MEIYFFQDAEGQKDRKSSVASPQCGPGRDLENLSLEEIAQTVEPTHTASVHTQEVGLATHLW